MKPLAALLALAMCFAAARGDVVVLANRTRVAIELQVDVPGQLPYKHRIDSGATEPLFVDATPSISFGTGPQAHRYALRLQSAYYFAEDASRQIDLHQIGIGDETRPPAARALPGAAAQTAPVMIPVRILVDDEEIARPAIWQRRLKSRVEAASQVMLAHAGVGFTVVGVGEWQTNNAQTDFHATLADFEQRVPAAPARLVIGFTSQFEATKGRIHLGGTRGPLASHILMREWSKYVSENERLELLIHELGHFLAAAHSPERDSVMRPVLGDRLARRTGFTIRFDPVNTLAMAMVGEELRRRRIEQSLALLPATQRRLAEIYRTLGAAQPDDQAANLLAQRLPAAQAPADPDKAGVANVLDAVVTAARKNRQSPQVLTGDALFDLYVQAAAGAARQSAAPRQREYFWAGLALALDRDGAMQVLPDLQRWADRVDSDSGRTIRRALIGQPTVGGRTDALQHFVVSAFITSARGRHAAESWGLAKETADMRPGGSGFSLADLAADYAGIRCAEWLQVEPERLAQLTHLSVSRDIVPPLDAYAEPFSAASFHTRFGTPADQRFLDELQRLQVEIDTLPVYQTAP